MIGSRTTETLTDISFPGLYVGHVEVIENDDDEYPGSIKVSIPSISGLSEGGETAVWARPCFPYGHFFVPEVNDKVWIAFENGNSHSPVWLGVWYPAGKTPSAAQISPPNKRVIQSSSNHQITFDDDENKIVIEYGSSGKGKIVFSDDKLEILFGTNKITLNNNGIQLEANRIDLN